MTSDLYGKGYAYEYDATSGQVNEYANGELATSVMVRAGLMEMTTRHAVIAELERLGYAVRPQADSDD